MNLKEQHIGIPTNDLVHFLPFWENGVKFKFISFIIYAKHISEPSCNSQRNNAELEELRNQYENLDICEEDKQVIDDYIACKDARADRMAEKLYEKGRKDVKRCIRIRKLIRRCMILSAIVTVVLVQYNKNEKLRESLEELLKMFRDGAVNESEEDF